MSTTTTTTTTGDDSEPAANPAELDAFIGRIAGDFATAAATSMIELGDRLGLYRVMLGRGPLTAADLADATGYNHRLVAEWLRSQAANQLMTYDPATTSYQLPPTTAAVLADGASPAFLVGAANIITSLYTDLDKVVAAFKGDGGVAWGDHDPCMFAGVEKFFSTAYNNSLTAEWIPALDGVEAKLRSGARVADVGCGHGISTALLAETYPNATVVGFDPHRPSLDRAAAVADARGLDIDYHQSTASELSGGPYDVICFFDCLHDMGDPVIAIARAREQLADDGTVFLVEMHAEDDLVANFADPFSRWWYAASVMLCTPSALAQGGEALGNQVGTAAWRQRFEANGFTRFREAMRTPFNIVLEARP